MDSNRIFTLLHGVLDCLHFVKEGEGFRVSGAYPLRDLQEKLKIAGEELGSGDVDTVSGYIVQELGRWPRVGDRVPFGPYTVRVTHMMLRPRRVGQVFVTPDTQETARQDGPGTS